MADISERAKQIAAAAIEGKYGAMDDDDMGYEDSPEEMAYGAKLNLEFLKNKKFLLIGGVTLVLVAAAVAGGVYWKKRQNEKTK